MATKKDPYQLASRTGAKKAPVIRRSAQSDEEVRARLKGYIRIPPEMFGTLPMNIHVKYLKAVPDEYGPHHLFAGFVVNSKFYVQYKKVGPKRMSFLLKANFKKPIVTWICPHVMIGFLYAKAPVTSIALHNEILRVTTALVTNVKRLASHYKKIDSSVKKMNKRLELLEGRR
jgi:hypothetical protein